MTPAAARLLDVLARERAAARAADLDALAALQLEKRQAVDALAATAPPDVERTELARAAEANVRLLAHLAACLRAFTGAESRTTYTTRGKSETPPPTRLRGAI